MATRDFRQTGTRAAAWLALGLTALVVFLPHLVAGVPAREAGSFLPPAWKSESAGEQSYFLGTDYLGRPFVSVLACAISATAQVGAVGNGCGPRGRIDRGNDSRFHAVADFGVTDSGRELGRDGRSGSGRSHYDRRRLAANGTGLARQRQHGIRAGVLCHSLGSPADRRAGPICQPNRLCAGIESLRRLPLGTRFAMMSGRISSRTSLGSRRRFCPASWRRKWGWPISEWSTASSTAWDGHSPRVLTTSSMTPRGFKCWLRSPPFSGSP